jgi:hypothetical protein
MRRIDANAQRQQETNDIFEGGFNKFTPNFIPNGY